MSDNIEQKILSLYALGNSYSQISEHIEEMYGMSFSKATISAVTDKVIPLLKEWQQRPLESIYPFVWLDAIHYKIKDNGRYISKAVYTVLGVGLNGKKEILEELSILQILLNQYIGNLESLLKLKELFQMKIHF